MDFYDIKRYAGIGLILEKAEKRDFNVTSIRIFVSVDRTEEVSLDDFSDDFKETMRNALKREQEHIRDSLLQLIRT